jgi:hypothetical protein
MGNYTEALCALESEAHNDEMSAKLYAILSSALKAADIVLES